MEFNVMRTEATRQQSISTAKAEGIARREPWSSGRVSATLALAMKVKTL